MARKSTKREDGVTYHRCACGKWFEGTQRRGRPHRLCPDCRQEARDARPVQEA